MNVFEAVKEAVSTKQVAIQYGFRPNHSGLICCPFHNDKTPSMKVDKRFYCFGCGATGDVIDFVSKLYGMDCTHAAIKIAGDFGVNYEYRGKSCNSTSLRKQNNIKRKYVSDEDEFNKKILSEIKKYSDCRLVLYTFKDLVSPKSIQDEWSDEFSWVARKITNIEYYLDILVFGSVEEQIEIIKRKEGEVENIGRYIRKHITRNIMG